MKRVFFVFVAVVCCVLPCSVSGWADDAVDPDSVYLEDFDDEPMPEDPEALEEENPEGEELPPPVEDPGADDAILQELLFQSQLTNTCLLFLIACLSGGLVCLLIYSFIQICLSEGGAKSDL